MQYRRRSPMGDAWPASKVGRCRVGWGMGRNVQPRPKTDFGVFWRPQNGTLLFYLHDKIWGGQFALASPTPNSGGLVPRLSSVIYAHAIHRCSFVTYVDYLSSQNGAHVVFLSRVVNVVIRVRYCLTAVMSVRPSHSWATATQDVKMRFTSHQRSMFLIPWGQISWSQV